MRIDFRKQTSLHLVFIVFHLARRQRPSIFGAKLEGVHGLRFLNAHNRDLAHRANLCVIEHCGDPDDRAVCNRSRDIFPSHTSHAQSPHCHEAFLLGKTNSAL
jgi:hypothetical protein